MQFIKDALAVEGVFQMLACREPETVETLQICLVLRPAVQNVVTGNFRPANMPTGAENNDNSSCADDARLIAAARAFLLRVGS